MLYLSSRSAIGLTLALVGAMPSAYAQLAIVSCEAVLESPAAGIQNNTYLSGLRDFEYELRSSLKWARRDVERGGPGKPKATVAKLQALVEFARGLEDAATNPRSTYEIVYAREYRGRAEVSAALARVDDRLPALLDAYGQAQIDLGRGRGNLFPPYRARQVVNALYATLNASIPLAWAAHHPGVSAALSAVALPANLFYLYEWLGDHKQNSYMALKTTKDYLGTQLSAPPRPGPPYHIGSDYVVLPGSFAGPVGLGRPLDRGMRRRAYALNSGFIRSWYDDPAIDDPDVPQTFTVDHIAFRDSRTDEPSWIVLIRAPRK